MDNTIHRINHYLTIFVRAIHLCGHDTTILSKHVTKTAGKYLRLHSMWSVTTQHSFAVPPTPYFFVYEFLSVKCNFILFNYINIHTHVFFSFLSFIFFFFSCSGMFRDVPECSMFLVLSTAPFFNGNVYISFEERQNFDAGHSHV